MHAMASCEQQRTLDFEEVRETSDCDRRTQRREQSTWRAAGAGSVGMCGDTGCMGGVDIPFRGQKAFCTAKQRVGRKAREALHAGCKCSPTSWNLENRHDRGHHHHRPKRFRTRGTAAADHSGQAARPTRRSPIVGSTSYMYDPPVSGISGYRLHLIMAPWRVSHWLGLARHLPNINSSAMAP